MNRTKTFALAAIVASGTALLAAPASRATTAPGPQVLAAGTSTQLTCAGGTPPAVAIQSNVATVTCPPSPTTTSTTSAPGGGATSTGSSATPARFAGTNETWLGWDENTGTYPTHAAIAAGLAQAKAAGFTVVRSQTLGISTGRPDAVEPSLGTWNSAAFDSIDYTLATADQLGLKVIIPLTDEWRYPQGGHWQFVHWAAAAGVPGVTDTLADLSQTTGNNPAEKAAEQQFYSNPTIIGFFEAYIDHLLTHVNAYDGIAIGRDPAIAGFESGNELYDSSAQQGCSACGSWTDTIARYVKSIAPGTTFIDGSASSGLGVQNASGLTSNAVDWIDAHYYGSYESVGQLASDAATAQAHGKALYVGEYDWTGSNVNLSAWLSAIESHPAIIGDSPWDELPVINSAPECHSDGLSFTDPATSGCADTQSAAVQAAAIDRWGGHATIMAGTNLVASRSVQVASPAALAAGGSNGTPTLSASSSGGTLVTATANAPFWVYAPNPATGASVTPGGAYTIDVSVSGGSSAGGLSLQPALSWFTAGGSWIATSAGTATTTGPGTSVITTTAVAPANAAYAAPQVQSGGSPTSGATFVVSAVSITAHSKS